MKKPRAKKRWEKSLMELKDALLNGGSDGETACEQEIWVASPRYAGYEHLTIEDTAAPSEDTVRQSSPNMRVEPGTLL